MKDSSSNLKFEYLYRDAGNYKQFGYLIIKNPSGVLPDDATNQLEKYLIDGEFFNPHDVNVPKLQAYEFDASIDHDWHQFESFSSIDKAATDSRTFEEFLKSFQQSL